MANKKISYTLEIDAEIKSLESKLNSVKNSMSGVLNSANAPKGLDKTFDKVEGLIDRIKNKASEPITSKGGFTSLEKDVDSVRLALASLAKTAESLKDLSDSSKISFLPPEEKNKIETAIKSLAHYADACTAAITETKELTDTKRALAAADKEVEKATN